MTDRFEYIIFTGFGFLFKLAGIKTARKFATVLAAVFFYLIPIRKETTIDNLSKAFPDYTPERIKKIAFGCYKSFAITLIEILLMPYMSRDEIKRAVNWTNLSFVKEKEEEKNGLLLLSAHFGNWEYMAASMGANLDSTMSVIVKPQRNKLVTDWLNAARTKWGNRVVSLGISIRQVYQELKEKRVVAMVADQSGPAEGIRVNLFGRKASVYTGPAVLSLKTKAPILYGCAVRQPDYTYTAEFFEIKTDDLPDDQEEKVTIISQRMTDILESTVRKYPEQWLWMHKRWKY